MSWDDHLLVWYWAHLGLGFLSFSLSVLLITIWLGNLYSACGIGQTAKGRTISIFVWGVELSSFVIFHVCSQYRVLLCETTQTSAFWCEIGGVFGIRIWEFPTIVVLLTIWLVNIYTSVCGRRPKAKPYRPLWLLFIFLLNLNIICLCLDQFSILIFGSTCVY